MEHRMKMRNASRMRLVILLAGAPYIIADLGQIDYSPTSPTILTCRRGNSGDILARNDILAHPRSWPVSDHVDHDFMHTGQNAQVFSCCYTK